MTTKVWNTTRLNYITGKEQVSACQCLSALLLFANTTRGLFSCFKYTTPNKQQQQQEVA